MDSALMARAAALDLAAVQSEFALGIGPDSPYHHREATALEYRRFLLLTLRYPHLDIHPGGSVEQFWRLHATQPRFPRDCAQLTAGTGVEPRRLVPPRRPRGYPLDDSVHGLYRKAFPCGDADLWGWDPAPSSSRNSAPHLGHVHTRLAGAIDESTRADLRREALSLRPSAAEGHSTTPGFSIERGCVTGGVGGFCYADPGPALLSWHWTGPLARRITETTGTAVVPTGVFYNYHRDGDGSPLHNDPFATELVVLTLLDGPIESLLLHPELADTPLTEVGALSERTGGHPTGGIPFDISPTPLLMSGQAIPHHRHPTSRDTEVVVAAQFFGVLASPPAGEAPHHASPGRFAHAAAAHERGRDDGVEMAGRAS